MNRYIIIPFIFQLYLICGGKMLFSNHPLSLNLITLKSKKDDSQLIANLIHKNKNIKLDNRIYYICKPIIINNRSNLNIIGNENTEIVLTSPLQNIFQFVNCTNINITNIYFNVSKIKTLYSSYPQLLGVPIYFHKSKNITISNCTFNGLITNSVTFYRTTGLIKIHNNKFLTNQPNQGLKADFISITSSAEVHLSIKKNIFKNLGTNPDFGTCGILLSNFHAIKANISRNIFINCGRSNKYHHRLAVIDLYNDCQNIKINKNVSHNTLWNFTRIANCSNVIIKNNTTYFKSSPDLATYNITLNKSLQSNSIQIINNKIINSLDSITGTAIGGIISRDSNYVRDIRIVSNKIINFRKGIVFDGSLVNMSISNNYIKAAVGLEFRNSTKKIIISNTQITSNRFHTTNKDIIYTHSFSKELANRLDISNNKSKHTNTNLKP